MRPSEGFENSGKEIFYFISFKTFPEFDSHKYNNKYKSIFNIIIN